MPSTTKSIFSVYFDLEENCWLPWDLLKKCTMYDVSQRANLLDF